MTVDLTTTEGLLADIRRRLTGNGDLNPDTLFPMLRAVADRIEVLTTLRALEHPGRTDGERRGIYVASRASLPERGEMWRKLRSEGWPINSTWIDEDGPKASRDLSGLWVRIAHEVTTAERLVLYVEPDDFPLKGALIEVGMALAAGVPVYIVAPGVVIEPRNMRPLGSWMLHPLVSLASTVEEALSAPLRLIDAEIAKTEGVG